MGAVFGSLRDPELLVAGQYCCLDDAEAVEIEVPHSIGDLVRAAILPHEHHVLEGKHALAQNGIGVSSAAFPNDDMLERNPHFAERFLEHGRRSGVFPQQQNGIAKFSEGHFALTDRSRVARRCQVFFCAPDAGLSSLLPPNAEEGQRVMKSKLHVYLPKLYVAIVLKLRGKSTNNL